MTLAELTEAMREHDRTHAPGSESPQWGDYLEDCRANGWNAFGNTAEDIHPPFDFVAYWRAIADRDYETALGYGDVDPDWFPAKRQKNFRLAPDVCAILDSTDNATALIERLVREHGGKCPTCGR